MKLYLDDNLASASLASHLRKAGHLVTVPSDVGTVGASDAAVTLTGDHEDFLHLHLLVRATGGRHPGILVIRRDNDPSRDMKDRDVERAIGNLEAAGVPIDNELHILNHWRKRRAHHGTSSSSSYGASSAMSSAPSVNSRLSSSPNSSSSPSSSSTNDQPRSSSTW